MTLWCLLMERARGLHSDATDLLALLSSTAWDVSPGTSGQVATARRITCLEAGAGCHVHSHSRAATLSVVVSVRPRLHMPNMAR